MFITSHSLLLKRVGFPVYSLKQLSERKSYPALLKSSPHNQSKSPKPFVLIVIPSDVYNTLSEEIRTELERYRFDVTLTNTDEEEEEEE